MPDEVMELLQGKRGLRELVDGMPAKRPAEAPPETKPSSEDAESSGDWILSPARGETYQACSRPANKPLATLHLLLADASSRGFSYANLDTIDLELAKEPGKGPLLVLRFCGIVPQEARISGRNLEGIRDYIGHHRLAWLQVIRAERDFLGDGEEVITGIEIGRMD